MVVAAFSSSNATTGTRVQSGETKNRLETRTPTVDNVQVDTWYVWTRSILGKL